MTDGARYRRKLLFLLSSATFFEGYDTFVLAFVLALVLGDLGGSEADAGWIRAITQLGAWRGSCSRHRQTGSAASGCSSSRSWVTPRRPPSRPSARARVANRRAVRRAGLPRRGVGGRDHDRRRGIPPGAPGTSPGHRDVDEHARRDLRRAACLHRVAEPRPRLAGLLPRRAAPARADRVRPPLDARDGPLRSRAERASRPHVAPRTVEASVPDDRARGGPGDLLPVLRRLGGRVLVGVLRAAGDRDERGDLGPVPRGGRDRRRERVPGRRSSDGPVRAQARVRGVHGGRARVRRGDLPDGRRRRELLACVSRSSSVWDRWPRPPRSRPSHSRRTCASRAAAWCRNAFEISAACWVRWWSACSATTSPGRWDRSAMR